MARQVGVPYDWLPSCEDNGDCGCIFPDGKLPFARIMVPRMKHGIAWLNGFMKSGLCVIRIFRRILIIYNDDNYICY